MSSLWAFLADPLRRRTAPNLPRAARVAIVSTLQVLLLLMAGTRAARAVSSNLFVNPALHTSQADEDADDCAIWIHPNDSSRSRIIGTDKGLTSGGLFVWNLAGEQIQHVVFPKPNNVDARRAVLIGGELVDLVVVNLRYGNGLKIFRMDLGDTLTEVTTAGGIHIPDFDPLGICLYRRPTDGVTFVIQTATDSAYQNVRQWRLESDGLGGVQTTFVRAFGGAFIAGDSEGIVADDELGYVYVAEQSHGIHKFYADPDSSGERLAVFATGDSIRGDREGLALYSCADRTGYILLSSQGNSTVKVYPREGSPGNPHLHEKITTIVTSGSEQTDGLDVTSYPVGPFTGGLLVKHDGPNRRFALYSWDSVAQGELKVCNSRPLSRPSDPVRFSLEVNQPNPFSASTLLSYRLASDQQITLSVFDLSGARVATLERGWRSAGAHSVVFRPRRLPSGVYFAVLESQGMRRVRRLVLAH